MATTKINFSRTNGRLSKATKSWADSVKARPDVPGSVLILVELARDAAGLADAARRAEDGRLYLSTASRLQQLIDLVERRSRDDRGDVGGGSGGAVEDGWAGELADVLRSGPSLVE